MQRGDVVALRLPKASGHEQGGKRYGVVVQSNAMLPRSVTLVAPTTTGARSASFRPEIVIGRQRAKVLVEQIGAVDSTRLGKVMKHLSVEETWAVDEAIRTVLELW